MDEGLHAMLFSAM